MTIARPVLSFGIIMVLAACLKSEGGGNSPEPDDVTRLGSNGIPFADSSGDFTDVFVPGQTITVPVVGMFSNGNDEVERFSVPGEVVLGRTEFGRPFVQELRIGTFVFESIGNALYARSPGGPQYRLDTIRGLEDGPPDPEDTYSDTLNFYSYEDGFIEELFMTVGLETDPLGMPITGTARYEGDFQSYGRVTFDGLDGGQFSGNGKINLSVDFSKALLNGAATVLLDAEPVNNPEQVTWNIRNGRISGNTFTASLDVIGSVSECAVECSDSSVIEGGFFGPKADEASGTAVIDASNLRPDDGVVVGFRGVGGFVTSKE